MQKTVVIAAVALLTGTGACFAQPAGGTRDMISRALPLEGAPKAEPGPYQVTSEAAFGAAGFHVYRPASLDAFPKKDTLPVMVWGNGGCSINSANFAGFLTTVASHGILVVGTVPQEGAAQRQENADDMRAAIDWAERENGRAGSPLSGKIALDKVAVMGTSCGGFLSITMGADPRVKTLGVFNSGVQTPPAGQAQAQGGRGGIPTQPSADALPKIHGTVLLLNGGDVDFLMGASAATFDLLNQVPAFYGSRHNGGHSATYFHPGGGEFANVASNWLMWTFKGDKDAGKMFAGKDCGLCTNSNWDVKSKGINK
jgi:dienelactone hydrolase